MQAPEEQYKPAEKLALKEISEDFPKTFKKVLCPSCESETSADNINLEKSVAICGNCNALFSIENDVATVLTKNETKQYIFRPEGIDLFFYKDDLEITIQQHIQGLDAFGIIFLPVLALFSIFIYYEKGIPIFFPIALTMGAIYFIYKAFNYSKNKSFIDVNDRFLSVKSRPKNFKKDKSYAADDIDQLYLKHSTDGAGYYAIHMIVNGLDGQKHVKLLTVNTLSKAKYLEQEIEQYLGIADRKVPEAHV